MTASGFFLQLQADVLDIPIEQASTSQVTSLGVAYMAGLAVGYWNDIAEIKAMKRKSLLITPNQNRMKIEEQYGKWVEYVQKTAALHSS